MVLACAGGLALLHREGLSSFRAMVSDCNRRSTASGSHSNHIAQSGNSSQVSMNLRLLCGNTTLATSSQLYARCVLREQPAERSLLSYPAFQTVAACSALKDDTWHQHMAPLPVILNHPCIMITARRHCMNITCTAEPTTDLNLHESTDINWGVPCPLLPNPSLHHP